VWYAGPIIGPENCQYHVLNVHSKCAFGPDSK